MEVFAFAGALGSVHMEQNKEKKRGKDFRTCRFDIVWMAAHKQCLSREERSKVGWIQNLIALLWVRSFSHLILFRWSSMLYLISFYSRLCCFTVANCTSFYESAYFGMFLWNPITSVDQLPFPYSKTKKLRSLISGSRIRSQSGKQ